MKHAAILPDEDSLETVQQMTPLCPTCCNPSLLQRRYECTATVLEVGRGASRTGSSMKEQSPVAGQGPVLPN
jgi:hypothetical protein